MITEMTLQRAKFADKLEPGGLGRLEGEIRSWQERALESPQTYPY